MGINFDKPHLWKQDIIQSVDLYNAWFMDFAPTAFRQTRITTAKSVAKALKETDYLNNVSPEVLQKYPEVLPILRMSTCPPNSKRQISWISWGFKESCAEYGKFRKSSYFTEDTKGKADN